MTASTSRQATLSRNGRASVTLALPAAVRIEVVVQVPRRKGNRITLVQQPSVYYTVG